MATTIEMEYLRDQLEVRRSRLETALSLAPQDASLAALLEEVDSALHRHTAGTYGLCESCHLSVERDRLLADPLVRFCLDHLTEIERAAFQRDLDLAAELQRRLLPPADLIAAGWETSYHYAPLGPVSGDYCDLFTFDSQLFFVLGDVSGKGVAASLRMTQLHALFRSLLSMAVAPAEVISRVNRFLCDSALAGQYATLVCGHAQSNGAVELFNAGHLPVIATRGDELLLVESTGLPLGMFQDALFPSTQLQLEKGDLLFLYTDGLSETRREDGEYGVDRVMNLIGRQCAPTAAGVVSASLADVREFAGTSPGLDDVTLLAIQRRG